MRDELLDEIEMVPYADGKLSWCPAMTAFQRCYRTRHGHRRPK